MLQKILLAWLGVSLWTTSGLSLAKDYEVEIVIFRKVLEADDGTQQTEAKTDWEIEQWDFSSNHTVEQLLKMANLAEQASLEQPSDKLIHLQTERFQLREAGYQILASASWQQPASAYPDAPVIDLGQANSTLVAGFVRIYTTALIFADVDLQLAPLLPINSDMFTAMPTLHYFIAESDQLTETTPASHYFIAESDQFPETRPTSHYFIAENDLFTATTPTPQYLIAESDQLPATPTPHHFITESSLFTAAPTPHYFITESNLFTTPIPHYFITEKRRLKFKQVHYFDHPYFGAILGVWPVEESELEDYRQFLTPTGN